MKGKKLIGILPTDTLYGLVGSALSKKAVERIYELKGRRPDKPLIILIASQKDLKLFGIHLDPAQKKIIAKFWPGPVSIILPCLNKRFEYLTRGTKTLAFRLPKKHDLVKILKKTGPLVAPSANPEGMKPANTVAKAKRYFGAGADFYIDGGTLRSKPSTLISIAGGKLEILRKGRMN